MLISVVISTYNRSELLKGCLESLTKQTANVTDYEVIIVDNNSSDKTEEVAGLFVKKYRNLRYVKEFSQGLSHVRNRGYKEALGQYVAYIDDDATASPDWIERILMVFKTITPKPVAVGGEILPFYEKQSPKWFTDDLETRTWGKEKGFLQPPTALYGFSGSNMVFIKEILESYGGFSSNLGMKGNKLRLGEETELFNRIYNEHPWFWYDPDIKVKHLVPLRNMTVSYRLKRAYCSGISNAYLYEKKSCAIILRNYLSLIIKGIISLFRVQWFQRYWQRSFLKNYLPVAYEIGFLKGLISCVRKPL